MSLNAALEKHAGRAPNDACVARDATGGKSRQHPQAFLKFALC
ncbi:hypothetical protein HMPREF0083_04892 [Aneurinibacillus aneurinilyticus ATCC 12856]|uniref:Uncharacterized protein n=1 Tax=Aneurinibacillus aneurinilyticus ATCC 12856 TaxID=649747 RepID=U1WWE4_ANEAE|nr:hypothetical protein HMPREF0083_04892 [Aneurinibacillus aneurinilyticus ATCC 12856]